MKHTRFLSLLLAVLMALLPCAAQADQGYLIPDSDTRRLTAEELWQWDYESLGYIFNEIFARHGYNFIAGGVYDQYFRGKPWYVPNEDSDNQRACYSQLTKLEWDNYDLIKAVRAEMRETGNYNEGGLSVWDQYTAGFDTLRGFEFITLAPDQMLAVYSAPDTASWRGANGNAAVSTNDNVFAAGWESGWLLVMYETDSGAVRVGYVDCADIRGDMPVIGILLFDYRGATVTRRCTFTDDPARTNAAIAVLDAGSQVTYLTTYDNSVSWAYVETVVDGKVARGFVPAECLQVEE